MLEILTEYQLATMEGNVFYRGSRDDFHAAAAAAFKMLASLHEKAPDSEEKVAVEVFACTSVLSMPKLNKELVKLGYLGG